MKKDLQNQTAKTDSSYEDLSTVTRMNQVYEAIRKPSKSNDTSMQGKPTKIPGIQVFQYLLLKIHYYVSDQPTVKVTSLNLLLLTCTH